jgi:hypothetical protein
VKEYAASQERWNKGHRLQVSGIGTRVHAETFRRKRYHQQRQWVHRVVNRKARPVA